MDAKPFNYTLIDGSPSRDQGARKEEKGRPTGIGLGIVFIFPMSSLSPNGFVLNNVTEERPYDLPSCERT